jgi:hypothetical protein
MTLATGADRWDCGAVDATTAVIPVWTVPARATHVRRSVRSGVGTARRSLPWASL